MKAPDLETPVAHIHFVTISEIQFKLSQHNFEFENFTFLVPFEQCILETVSDESPQTGVGLTVSLFHSYIDTYL